MMNKNIQLLLLFVFAIFLFSCSSKEKNLTFVDWDANNDNLISKIEFTETFTENYYDDWDNDDDPYLDDEDFLRSVFYVWDNNKDEKLEVDEWILGYDYFYGNYIIEDFTVIDTDKDGSIEYAEYEKIISPTGMFLEWDINHDGEIDENELANGLFEIWDIDNSRYIELDEYTKFDSYYVDF